MTEDVTKVTAIKANRDKLIESFKLVAAEVVDTTLKIVDDKVVASLNNTAKTIKVEYNKTVKELKAALATVDSKASFKVLTGVNGVEVAETGKVTGTMVVEVTGKDGKAKANYTVTVNTGTVTGIIVTDKNVVSLSTTTLTVDEGTTVAQLLAAIKADDAKATIKVVTSSSDDTEVKGSTALVATNQVVVTAQDGTTKQSYTIAITAEDTTKTQLYTIKDTAAQTAVDNVAAGIAATFTAGGKVDDVVMPLVRAFIC